jgi:hypothetical protein
MNTISKWTVMLTLCLGTAYGQVPSTNDTSDGNYNTGMGAGALGGPTPTNLTGCCNTASGASSLNYNTTGTGNTAFGYQPLEKNMTGSDNTALGVAALFYNTTGNNNTAVGFEALPVNNTDYNTAIGFQALHSNTSGCENTAIGTQTLYSNTTSCYNSALGYKALYANTGAYNTAIGQEALTSNESGGYNTASGVIALYSNTTGSNNTAVGLAALETNTTGSNNIALGSEAGINVVGSNNIDIGNEGEATDKGIIRIGNAGSHKGAFIAGIESYKISTGSAVYVTAAGRLGVLASSERYKTAIAPIGSDTAKLQKLRPVKFHLKTDPHGAVQYGLIAEEVAKVYPELVIRDEKGRIDGLRYDELAPMLLNEVQKQQRVNAAQAARIASLEQQLSGIQAALVKLQHRDELVAQR